MNANETSIAAAPGLSVRATVLYSLGAIASFHLAYTFSSLAWLMIVYLGCLAALTRIESNRRAFYTGMLVGLAAFVPQMSFLWTIFGPAAVPLWVILAFWHGLFLMLGRQCWIRFGRMIALLLLPFLWTGLEYFRSEIYFLRFSWFNAGGAFWEWPSVIATLGGVYGVGFCLFVVGELLSICSRTLKLRHWAYLAIGTLTAVFAMWVYLSTPVEYWHRDRSSVSIAGIQLEFPNFYQAIDGLNKVVHQYPDAELLVLSEYTFDGPIPDAVKAWCRQNHRWLIAGGHDELGGGQYYNTAFVVSTNGDIAFKQAKCMPIQFFKDGLPAKEQKLWNSPWGKIGLCVCYDLNYRRVTDELIRQGAQAIIVPTMDVADWGAHQHELHARTAPIRAAEYGVPIFRLCSSGISQIVDRDGTVATHASFPGEGDMIAGRLTFNGPPSPPARPPYDQFLAPFALVITYCLVIYFSVPALVDKIRSRFTAVVPQKPQTANP